MLLATLLGGTGYLAYSMRADALDALKELPEVAERLREGLWRNGDSPARHMREAAEALQSAATGDDPSRTGRGSAQQRSAATDATEWVQFGVGSVLALAGHVTVVVFLVFFLLVSGGHFGTRLVEIAGRSLERRRVTANIIAEINAQIQRFLLVHLVTAAVVALATWAVLAWLGLAQPAVWGIAAGVFNSIPYLGPVVVSGGLLIVGWVQSGDLTLATQVSLAALVITSLEGWLLTPPLLGKAERMHVLVVFLGVLIWTWIWGAWGTILAVPMLVVLKAVADHVESLKPLSRLMSP
jgi:predicted PurR-regulated permease PerM